MCVGGGGRIFFFKSHPLNHDHNIRANGQVGGAYLCICAHKEGASLRMCVHTNIGGGGGGAR